MWCEDNRCKSTLSTQSWPPDFIKNFQSRKIGQLSLTNRSAQYPTIKNAPLPADGPGNDSFSNTLLFSLLGGIPLYMSWKVGGGFKTTIFFGLLTSIPILVGFWTVFSSFSPRRNEKA